MPFNLNSARRLGRFVGAGLLSREECIRVLRLDRLPLGSAVQCEAHWALNDAAAEECCRPTLIAPSLASVHAAIATRKPHRRGPVWGDYCPLYEPDLIELEYAAGRPQR